MLEIRYTANRTIRIDFYLIFSVSSPAPEMRKCVCVYGESIGSISKKIVHGTRTTSDYIPRVDQSTRVKFNRSPSFFPTLSPPRLSFRFLYSDAREEKSQQKFFKREKEEKTLWGRRKCGDGIFTTGRHTQKRGGECQTIAKKKDPRFIQRHTRRDGRRRRRFEIFMKRISASSLYYAAQDYIRRSGE
jgi:hypothetical protein